ncbi:MAG: preprotein translocase subunit SecY [Candidatus Thermoplasmatota archaeon]|nr:preprotein translocase subunit SecY [Euryarchaeota archaeon]MBU4031923.1 preprotein translocase subunit SecY [Candidatus Thermoplasmatota archaeon]MBU4071514.1 preprotein translocase subunit SecY [Candidatus Thermoplasmatota archaeon]MBU4144163.1 preprotein translocase subunit SecY [Candidatus Thermoplasmatota archaeon]MBU4592797.1 preprotein translocase subunit SecY [Candidatus Thermoplasmatota archaeon]
MSEGESKKSLLYKLKPIYDRLPTIKKPDGHVHFKTKMFWLVLILILYFILTNVMIYGLDQENTIDLFESYRAIMAGAQGSLMHLGIGPIVTGSIIMQLFVGAKIIKLDLKDDDDKAVYQGAQKFLVIVMIIVESVPQVYGYLVPSDNLIGNIGGGWAKILIIAQLCFGSYLVFLMDETVSKWGIGSGISLFIAAGVAQQIFTGTLNWMPVDSALPTSLANPPAGTVMKTIYYFTNVSAQEMSGGYFETLLINPPNPIIALIGTLVIFFFVAYIESVRIELPLAHESARGARGRYPIKLIYASNIPVILIAAVLANVGMFAMLFWSNSFFSTVPLIGQNPLVGYYADFGSGPQLTGGAAWYVSTLGGLQDWLLPIFDSRYLPYYETGVQKSLFQVMVRLFVYVAVMIFGSILFAKFWIDTTNMGPKSVAEQIQSSGMQIPGFRRDPRILEKVLERYIPVVTVLSGAIVGGLAAFADMLGTVGNSSGTGVLLAVGIMIQTYEAMGREQMMEMHPMLRGFFGGDG